MYSHFLSPICAGIFDIYKILYYNFFGEVLWVFYGTAVVLTVQKNF